MIITNSTLHRTIGVILTFVLLMINSFLTNTHGYYGRFVGSILVLKILFIVSYIFQKIRDFIFEKRKNSFKIIFAYLFVFGLLTFNYLLNHNKSEMNLTFYELFLLATYPLLLNTDVVYLYFKNK